MRLQRVGMGGKQVSIHDFRFEFGWGREGGEKVEAPSGASATKCEGFLGPSGAQQGARLWVHLTHHLGLDISMCITKITFPRKLHFSQVPSLENHHTCCNQRSFCPLAPGDRDPGVFLEMSWMEE